jgi:hypothetical protein
MFEPCTPICRAYEQVALNDVQEWSKPCGKCGPSDLPYPSDQRSLGQIDVPSIDEQTSWSPRKFLLPRPARGHDSLVSLFVAGQILRVETGVSVGKGGHY